MTDDLAERIKKAAQVFVAAGAREVYLFGSAANGTMREDSDIDFATRGLPDEFFFRTIARAADVLQCPLDLVELSDDSAFTRYLEEEKELVRVA